MLEFTLVDHPMIFPQACIACRSAKGPQLDTHVELPSWGWVYLCQSCAKRAAVQFGFSAGERMDELAEAADSILGKDREIASLLEQVHNLVAHVDQRDSEIREKAQTIEELSGRVSQLEGALVQSGAEMERHLQLVGAVAGDANPPPRVDRSMWPFRGDAA